MKCFNKRFIPVNKPPPPPFNKGEVRVVMVCFKGDLVKYEVFKIANYSLPTLVQ